MTIGAGVVVRFCGNGRLIIKPNARLNLHGTLTNSCGTPWKGVEIWGNSSQSQYTVGGVNGQGRLVGYTGSVIENADIGVQLWGPDYFANSGGIVSCNGTTFRNNRRAVEFAPYNNFWPYQVGPTGQTQNYSASFGRCNFITDDGYPNPLPFEAFLYMKGVRGVRITGSSFTNNQTASPGSIVGYGYGIHATDAGFRVQSACNGNTYPCNDYTHTTFNNLGYAIYTANVVGNQPFSVQRARFNGCYYGIYNKAVSQGTLLFNVFNLGNVPDASLTQDQFGTFFEVAMSGFTFQENTFQKVAGNVANTVGSYNKDLAFFDGNVLRRNTCNGVSFGNIAEKTNAYYNTYVPRGLHYLCNTNTGVTEADFSVLAGSNIRRDQGQEVQGQTNSFDAAGNKFSQIAIDFQNLGSSQIRYHKNPNAPLEDPITVVGNVQKIDADPNTCPTIYCDPPCKEQYELDAIKSDYFVKRNDYNAAKAAYDAAVASGDTVLAEQKGHEMAFARHIMDTSSFMVTLHLLYDTATFQRDSLLVWFSHMDNPSAQLQLAKDYLGNGQPAQATAALSQAATLFGLNSVDAADFSDLVDIFNLIDTQSVYNLDSATLAALDAYTTTDGREATVFTQNIRTMYGSHYPPRYQLPGVGERTAIVEQESTAPSSSVTLAVAPNPSSGFVEFTVRGAGEGNTLLLTVSTLEGRSIWQHSFAGDEKQVTWTAENAPAGIYLYRLTFAGGTPAIVGKIVLTK